ncbi:MAG: tRNA pseudouridine(55) synthase TruB [Planctomycetota bacterium]
MGRRRRRQGPTRSGGAVFWKPAGITSRRAVEEAERRLGVRPLGHTGTLDPLAAGILVVLGGEARKFQHLITDHDKCYEARVVLGIESGSEDAEGPLWCRTPRLSLHEPAAVEAAVAGFEGSYEQTPPQLSAVRVAGERAHKRARRGEDVAVPARSVRIDRIEIVDCAPPLLQLRVACGPGTYIRSLARDLGERLGTGAFLAGLRRTAVGTFQEADAKPLTALTSGDWLPLEEIVRDAPRVDVPRATAERLALGQRVPHAVLPDDLAVVWCDGAVVGIAEPRGEVLQPRRWVQPDDSR